MKICQQCRHQNEDSMSFCLECGAPLPSPIVVNIGGQNTQSHHGATPTNFGVNKDPKTVAINNQGSFGTNFQQALPPPRKKSNTKIFLIVGGIGALVLLFAVAGIAIIGYNVVNAPKPTPYPTTFPTTSPTKTSTPLVVTTITPTINPTVKPAGNGSAKFTKMKVDFNITENNRLGMRIKVNFTTFKMKGVESYLVVYFQKKDGTALPSQSDAFQAPNGDLAALVLLTPAFDEALYKDLAVFMPYDELNVGKGKFDLQMCVDVILKNGDLVEHLNTYAFEYDEK